MKRLLFLSLIVCLTVSSCYQQQRSLYRKERDGIIYNQHRHTPFRKIKLKTPTGIEYFAVSKDTSGNFIIGITIQEQKRHYFFIYLKSKLAYARVSEDVADKKVKWKNGYYYFQDDNLVYKEETEANIVNIEETKMLAENYLLKAKTL